MPSGILTLDQLDEVISDYFAFDEFVVDVETMGEHRGNPHRNDIFWISLAGPGRADVIPCGHPVGERIERDPDDEFYRTYNGKHQEHRVNESSGRLKWVTVPDPFEEPPKQLWVSDVLDALRPLFFSTKRRIIGQNIKFDIESMAKYWGGVPPGPYGDTLVAAKLINENFFGYKLGQMVQREFHYEYEKIGKAGPEKFPFSEAYTYSYLDAKYTWLLWRKFKPLLDKEGVRHIFDLEMDVLPAIIDMERAGITIDEIALDDLGTEFMQEMGRLKLAINKAAGYDINLNANAQLAELVYDTLGHTCKVFTEKTNAPSTSAETLEDFGNDPVVAKILDHAKLAKLQSTFVLGIQRNIHDGRIHPSINQMGAVTGRMSCVAADSLIEMPRDLRKWPDGVPITAVSAGDYVYAFDWQRELVLKRVKWVGQTGVRETVIVTVENSEGHRLQLRLTPEHLVRLRSGDWRSAGSLLHRWGQPHRNDGPRVMTMVRRGVDAGYVKFWPHSVAKGWGSTVGKVREHRWIVEQMTGKRISTKTDVHHIDGNGLNNHPDNLEKLTVAEHRGWRDLHPHWGDKLNELPHDVYSGPTDYLVVGVVPGKVEPVWDMEVEAVHNFIANGICVHNCSEPNIQQIPSRSERGKRVREVFIAG